MGDDKIVEDICLRAGGRIRLKRVWNVVQQVGNRGIHDYMSGGWQFHSEVVASTLRVSCTYLGEREHGEGKTRNESEEDETTDLLAMAK